MTIEKELIKTLKKLLGARVTYSRAGGGMSSILLITTSNHLSLWCWRYWEISQCNVLLSTSEDDDTPITGTMAKAASLLENKSISGFMLDTVNEYQLWLCFDDDLDLILFPEYEKLQPEEKETYKDAVPVSLYDNFSVSLDDIFYNVF